MEEIIETGDSRLTESRRKMKCLISVCAKESRNETEAVLGEKQQGRAHSMRLHGNLGVLSLLFAFMLFAAWLRPV